MPFFRSFAQELLLAQLLVHADSEFSIGELCELTELAQSSVSEEISKLESAGVVTSRQLGRNKLVSADRDYPGFASLRELVSLGYGVPVILADELRKIKAEAVILFGSYAARLAGEPGPTPDDIDILVLGNSIDRDKLYQACQKASDELRIPVNPVVRPPKAWTTAKDPLVTQIKSNHWNLIQGELPDVE